MLNFVS